MGVMMELPEKVNDNLVSFSKILGDKPDEGKVIMGTSPLSS